MSSVDNGLDRLSTRLVPMPPPVQLFLELTSACNLRCKHCYIRAGEGKTYQIQPAFLHTLIRDFWEMGGGFVTFSGGEPTLYHGWRAAIKYARFLGLETTLLTNAVTLSTSDMRFLADFDVHVAISLDGASPKIHDAIRGQGSFARTLAVTRIFSENGMGPSLTICFTPMATNYRELPAIVALASKLGAGRVYVSLLENRGRAALNFGQIVLSLEDKQRLLYTIYSLQERYPQIQIQCTNLRYFTERLHGIEIDGDALDRTIRITAKGEVFLTAYLDAEPFYLGLYKEGCLEEMWYSLKVSSAFDGAGRRRTSIPLCMKCEYWYWCRGGSAALAQTVNNTFFSVDSYCTAKKAVVKEILGERFLWRTP